MRRKVSVSRRPLVIELAKGHELDWLAMALAGAGLEGQSPGPGAGGAEIKQDSETRSNQSVSHAKSNIDTNGHGGGVLAG